MLNFSLTPSTGTFCEDGANDPDGIVNCGVMGPSAGHICVKCGGQFVIGLDTPGAAAHFDYMFVSSVCLRSEHIPLIHFSMCCRTEIRKTATPHTSALRRLHDLRLVFALLLSIDSCSLVLGGG